jgi:hypothetical protein
MKSHPHEYSMKSRFNEKPLQWKAASMKSRSTVKSIIVQAFECTDFCGDGKKIAEKNLSSFILIFLEIKFFCGNTAFDRITLNRLACGRRLTEWHLGIVKVYQQIEVQENDTQQNNIWQKGAQQNDIRQKGIQKNVIWHNFPQTGLKNCHQNDIQEKDIGQMIFGGMTESQRSEWHTSEMTD